MKLSDIIDPDNIIVPLKSSTKENVLKELLDHLQSRKELTSTLKLNDSLNNQEKMFSSAAGKGLAFPACGSIEVKSIVAVLGISKLGVDFNASDGLKCNLILLTLSNKEDPKRNESDEH